MPPSPKLTKIGEVMNDEAIGDEVVRTCRIQVVHHLNVVGLSHLCDRRGELSTLVQTEQLIAFL